MPEIEQELKFIPIDDNLPKELEKLTAEGWVAVAGVKPIAIYPVVRQKKEPTAAGVGELSIDETKIGVLRANGDYEYSDGRVQHPDGTITPPPVKENG